MQNKKRFIYITISILFVVFIFSFRVYSALRSQGSEYPKSKIDQLILKAQLLKDLHPHDARGYIGLANVYLEKVRETADYSYYEKIDTLMAQAKKIDPANANIPATLASIDLGRHDFKNALVLGQDAIKLNPHTAIYYGIVSDAQVQLGQYEKAQSTLEQMIAIRPDLSSYNRIAYFREIYGDVVGAKASLLDAVNASSTYPENVAWSQVQLGRLAMRNDLSQGKIEFLKALQMFPNYPSALEGLGEIAFFEHDVKKAQIYFTKAFAISPIAQYAVAIADTYSYEQNDLKAKQYQTLAIIAFEQSRQSGMNIDFEEAGFYLEHDLQLSKALDLAKSAYKIRPTLFAADTLSFAYYKNNDLENALKYSNEAVRLGENDALILYHRGLLYRKLGDVQESNRLIQKAVIQNQTFSIFSVSKARAFIIKS